MRLIWITKANYLNEYQIEIEFNNNKKGVVDLVCYLLFRHVVWRFGGL